MDGAIVANGAVEVNGPSQADAAERINRVSKPNVTPQSDGVSKDDDASKGGIETGHRSEIKYLEERYNKAGEIEIIEVGAHRSGSKERFEDYALVMKQSYNKDSTIRTASIQVNSPHLLRILHEVVGAYPTQPAGFEVPIIEEAPFPLFYHYRTEIAQYDTRDDEVSRTHHKLLMKHIDAELGRASAEAAKLVSKGFITFALLWVIFKPGELLYASSYGHARLYRLDKTLYRENIKTGPFFEVHCSYVDYNGTNVGRAREKLYLFDVRHFTGRNPSEITSLPVYPRKFVGDEGLEARLTSRGKGLLELKGIRVMEYDGLLEYLKLPPYSWWGPACERDGQWLPITVAGRVVVDKRTFSEDFADKSVSVDDTEAVSTDTDQNAYLHVSGISVEDLDELNPMLCPPFSYGYALDRKVWCKLYVDQMWPVNWRPDPMDDIILPDNQKKVLRALIGSHIFPEQSRNEIALKGKGLVVLLHGTPGTGKTLTAEVAAEHTKRALLKISLSELKVDNGSVGLEETMTTFQRYASHWKAIILIDEADIFLEARTSEGSGQAERNGLVAVFLRTLEYFQGIIFLTSNRVNVFDVAIKSRLHLALQYSAPTASTRRQLWQMRLETVPAADRNFNLQQVLDSVQQSEMNGREISNSINTALTLARDEKKKLEFEHLQTIIQVWEDFGVALEKDGKSLDMKII